MISSSQSGARGFTNDTETRGDEALSMETALGVETGKAAVPWSTNEKDYVKLRERSTASEIKENGTSPSISKTRWVDETRSLLNLSLPIIASNLLMVAMQMTDLGFIGRIGKEELAAAALGNTVFYLRKCVFPKSRHCLPPLFECTTRDVRSSCQY